MPYYNDTYLSGIKKCVVKAISQKSLKSVLASSYLIEECRDCNNPSVDSTQLLEWKQILDSWDNINTTINGITETEFRQVVSAIVVNLNCTEPIGVVEGVTYFQQTYEDLRIGTGTNYTISNGGATLTAAFLVDKILTGVTIAGIPVPLRDLGDGNVYASFNAPIGQITLGNGGTFTEGAYVRIEYTTSGALAEGGGGGGDTEVLAGLSGT